MLVLLATSHSSSLWVVVERQSSTTEAICLCLCLWGATLLGIWPYLGQIADVETLPQLRVAVVRLVAARQQPQQRALPAAVGAHYGDAIASTVISSRPGQPISPQPPITNVPETTNGDVSGQPLYSEEHHPRGVLGSDPSMSPKLWWGHDDTAPGQADGAEEPHGNGPAWEHVRLHDQPDGEGEVVEEYALSVVALAQRVRPQHHLLPCSSPSMSPHGQGGVEDQRQTDGSSQGMPTRI